LNLAKAEEAMGRLEQQATAATFTVLVIGEFAEPDHRTFQRWIEGHLRPPLGNVSEPLRGSERL
jgi:hypothetical protein